MKRPLLPLLLSAGCALACGLGGDATTTTTQKREVITTKAGATEEPKGGTSCDQPIATPPHTGCMISTLSCGDSVQGNTEQGLENWGDEMYQKAFCTPQRHDYETSPENVYELVVPGDMKAIVTLDSPCADLDVVAMSWADTAHCPDIGNSGRVRECEMDTKPGGGTLTLTTVTKPQTYLLAVDGKNGDTGNYALSVECSTYR